MSTAGDYLHYQRYGRNLSGSATFVAADAGPVTLVTLPSDKAASHTVYVQRISIYIKTSAAQTLTVQDTNSTPREVAKVPSAPGDSTKFTWDFGPKGYPLTEGKNLSMVFSSAGLAGHIEVEAYSAQSSTFGLS